MVELVDATLNGKWRIKIPAHRADRPEWYQLAGWEKIRLEAMHECIKNQKDPVVYYVGAEEGEMPALCQMWGAEVVMFEPNPKVWPNIKAIWEGNKLEPPRMTFVGFAGRESTEGALDRATANGFPECADGPVIGDHGFMNLSEIDRETTAAVSIDQLDGLFKKKVTLLTMDVEGSEWEVLRGAEETLRKDKPVIFLSLHPEFMYEMYHEYAYDCRNWIRGLGYEEQLLDYQHEVHLAYWPKEQA